MIDELTEELARAIEHGLAYDVESDVYAGETCIEERRCIAARIIPIIHRREIEAGEKVKEAAVDKLDECCEPCFQCNQNLVALDIPAALGGKHD